MLHAHTIADTDQPSTVVVEEECKEVRLPSSQELAPPFKADGASSPS